MHAPGYKIIHQADLDTNSTCLTFVSCHPTRADVVGRASRSRTDGHPDRDEGRQVTEPHVPRARTRDSVGVHRRTSSSRPTTYAGARPRWARPCWPTAGRRSARTRGKVYFTLDNEGFRARLPDGHPSLRGRLLFTPSAPGQDDAAFAKLNDPDRRRGQDQGRARRAHDRARPEPTPTPSRPAPTITRHERGAAGRCAARQHRLRAARSHDRQRLRRAHPRRHTCTLRPGDRAARLHVDRRREPGAPRVAHNSLSQSRASRRSRCTRREERARVRAVDGAVVEARNRGGRSARSARPPSLVDHDLLRDAVGREYPDLRAIDDRERDPGAATRPGFVIVNVPPARSSGASFRARAVRDVADRGGEGAEPQAVGVVHDGTTRP